MRPSSKSWFENAKAALFAHSIEKENFDAARAEWRITERIVDNYRNGCIELPACELCRHENLRWQFEIANRRSGAKLLVGSSCITKFDFGVGENGEAVFHGAIRDGLLELRVRRIMDGYLRDAAAGIMHAIRSAEEGSRIEAVESFWKANGFLSPRLALDLAQLCLSSGADRLQLAVPVNIRTLERKIEIVRMSDEEYSLLEAFLDEGQRKRCEKMRRPADGWKG